jgi:hypothetical protein
MRMLTRPEVTLQEGQIMFYSNILKQEDGYLLFESEKHKQNKIRR